MARLLVGLGHRRAFLDELEISGIKTGSYNLPDWNGKSGSLDDLLDSVWRFTDLRPAARPHRHPCRSAHRRFPRTHFGHHHRRVLRRHPRTRRRRTGDQVARFKSAKHTTNAAKQVRECCKLDAEGRGYLERAMEQMNFSARAHDPILKVARTLAGLAGKQGIGGNEVLEAIPFRSQDRRLE